MGYLNSSIVIIVVPVQQSCSIGFFPGFISHWWWLYIIHTHTMTMYIDFVTLCFGVNIMDSQVDVTWSYILHFFACRSKKWIRKIKREHGRGRGRGRRGNFSPKTFHAVCALYKWYSQKWKTCILVVILHFSCLLFSSSTLLFTTQSYIKLIEPSTCPKFIRQLDAWR